MPLLTNVRQKNTNVSNLFLQLGGHILSIDLVSSTEVKIDSLIIHGRSDVNVMRFFGEERALRKSNNITYAYDKLPRKKFPFLSELSVCYSVPTGPFNLYKSPNFSEWSRHVLVSRLPHIQYYP